MKQKLAAALLAVTAVIASTPVFGQTTYIWTGGGDQTNIDVAANWGGTLPATGSSDTGEFNGLTTSNLFLNYSVGNWASGPGSSGVNLYLTGLQTNSVTLDNYSANANPPNIAISSIAIDAGAGAFSWDPSGNRVNYAARPGGAVHTAVNNSTNTATIGTQIHWVAGSGSAYTWDFSGSGNWVVNNYLQSDNSGGGVTMQVDGPGTVTWNPNGSYAGADNINAVNINGGTLVLAYPHPKIVSRAISDYGAFVFDSPAQSQTLSGVISGYGIVRVNNGTLTLGGASTYGATNVLAGGELIVNSVENPGTSGPLGLALITFQGGTLGYSLNNTFDYSSRFNTDVNQAYSIDTAGQSVTFATGLSSVGGTLTKVGTGTLTLTGPSTYTGLTTVSVGRLVFQGSKSGAANIVVQDGAILGVYENGSQIAPANLTVGTSSGGILNFNNVTNQTTPTLAAGTITAVGPITVNINSGSFNTIGQQFPLFSWNSGSAPAVTLGAVSGAAGTLTTNGNTIVLTITSTPYVWTGGTSGTWDESTSGNWVQSGTPKIFTDGVLALFDDTALGNTSMNISGVVQPATITFNNSSQPYSITSSAGNYIGGTASLTVNGSSTVTLSGGANTNTGVTTINAGVVSVSTLANGGSASDIGATGNNATNLVINGGTLQYTGGGASIDHLFTLGASGGTLDGSGSSGLNLTNTGSVALSGSGTHTLILTGIAGSTNILGASVANSAGGATAVTKNGASKWILTGANTYSGLTTINAGSLQIGAGGLSGSAVSGNVLDNARLVFNSTNTVTVSGTVSGSGSVTQNGPGTAILSANSTYTGGTTVNAGTLQFGNGGATGTAYGGSAINDNGTVIFNTTTTTHLSGFGNNINGTGNVRVQRGLVISDAANNYTGWTEIDAGATFQPCLGQTGGMLSSVMTNNGALLIESQNSPATFGFSNNIVGTGSVRADIFNQNAGWGVIAGTNNTYTGGTIIAGGGIVLGDGVTPGSGTIVGSVVFTNSTGPFIATGLFNTSKRLLINRPDNFTMTNNIYSKASDGSSAANSGSLEQMGPGSVTLTGTNTYPGDTTIDAGATLQAGIGGTVGSIGSGQIVDNGTLIFDRSDSVTKTNALTGAGALVQFGSGALTFTGNGTGFNGTLTVSNGTLAINGTNTAGYAEVFPGGTLRGTGVINGSIIQTDPGSTLAAGASSSSIGTFTVPTTLLYGNVAIKVDKSQAQSNDVVAVVAGGSVVNYGTGNTLTVTNLGPALKVGDTFQVFSQPFGSGGAGLTVTGAGATWQNNLDVDGTITALTVPLVNTNPPVLQVTVSGNTLNLAWPTNRYWTLLTNSVGVNAPNSWFAYPNSETFTNVSIPINKANPKVFFRLVYTNTP